MAADIDAAIALASETGADSIRTMVNPEHFNPYKMWAEAGEQGRVEPLFPIGREGAPRQEMKAWFMPIAAVYMTRASFIREGKLWGDDVRMLPFPLDRFVDIDYPADMIEAERILIAHGLV
jgi:CMP-N-acetylneuraminic acid synthetase